MLDRLIELLSHCVGALVFWVVMDPYERGIMLRLGLFHRELPPGFHWKIPFGIERWISENVVPRTERISGLSTTTTDGKSVGFEAVITYQIRDIKKSLLEVNDLKDAIADSCAGIIGTKLSDSSWADILHGKALEDVASECRKRGFRYGVEIMSVQLTGIALVRNLRLSMSGMPHPGKTAYVNFPA